MFLNITNKIKLQINYEDKNHEEMMKMLSRFMNKSNVNR